MPCATATPCCCRTATTRCRPLPDTGSITCGGWRARSGSWRSTKIRITNGSTTRPSRASEASRRGSRPDVTATRAQIVRAVESFGVVAIIRLKDAARLRAVVDALAAGGVRAIEVTMTVPGAVDLIRELASTLTSEFLLGAGTVVDAKTAAAVIDAGARFIVSPVFRPEVVRACHERDVPAMPGCFSPTEILAAHDC